MKSIAETRSGLYFSAWYMGHGKGDTPRSQNYLRHRVAHLRNMEKTGVSAYGVEGVIKLAMDKVKTVSNTDVEEIKCDKRLAFLIVFGAQFI